MITLPLRPPATVMQLDRLGASHQTRLSFVRSLVRKMMAEQWQIERTRFDLDGNGYGTAVYTVTATASEQYSLVFFAQALADDQRTDRVIAEAWDVAFALCVGLVDQPRIAALRDNLPHQELGRYTADVLVISRANKSTRNFAAVLDALCAGQQPDISPLITAGYLYRTTAVYGNGKFGIADYARVNNTRSFDTSFRAQMFTVYMMRHFASEQIEHVARFRAPDTAVPLADPIKRYLGIGNSTGLGMAPFLVTHPAILNQWLTQRETALARVCAEGTVTATKQVALLDLVEQAHTHTQQITTSHPLQAAANAQLVRDLEAAHAWLSTADPTPDLWTQLLTTAEQQWELEAQELLVAMLIELYPELADPLGEKVDAHETIDYQPQMSVAALHNLIKANYGWVLAIDFNDQMATEKFWYRSANKEEPRLGDRYQEAGADQEQFLGIGRAVATCWRDLEPFYTADPTQPTITFLLRHPEHKEIVRRIQQSAHAPYAEIQANLLAADTLPIHLLRAKLAMFGASKFDPKSNLWVRITLFQGAPLLSEIGQPFHDDWFLPIAPQSEMLA